MSLNRLSDRSCDLVLAAAAIDRDAMIDVTHASGARTGCCLIHALVLRRIHCDRASFVAIDPMMNRNVGKHVEVPADRK